MTGPAPDVAPDYACSCGAELRACAHWAAVGRAMQRRGHAFDPLRWDVRFDLGRRPWSRFLLSRSLRSNRLDEARDRLVAALPGPGARLRELRARNAALAASLLEVSGRPVLADASKHPVRARFLSRLPEVELRVLHLVRDAPGLVSSRMANQGFSLDSSIRFWNRGAAQAERLVAALPGGRTLRVRYEDLCRDPHAELGRIAGWAGVAPFPAEVRWREGDHHIVGNRMRLADAREIRLDERWRERLAPAQVDEVLRRTGSWRTRLGYT